MPINLQNPENIGTGWPGPPQLSAPNIGELVKSILANRLARDKMTQESISDTIKNLQTQREDSAYTEALRNAGLTQGQDISGLGSARATALAKLIQEQTPDIEMDALHQAMARAYNARADTTQTYADMTEPETYTDPQGITWRRTKSGWTPMPTGLQPTDVRGQSEQQQLQEENKLLQRKGDLEALSESEKQAHIKELKPNVPFSRADEYNRMVQRLKEIQSGRTQPQAGGGAASNLAPGYGTQGVKMKAPDGTISTVDPDKVEYFKSKGAVVVP